MLVADNTQPTSLNLLKHVTGGGLHAVVLTLNSSPRQLLADCALSPEWLLHVFLLKVAQTISHRTASVVSICE